MPLNTVSQVSIKNFHGREFELTADVGDMEKANEIKSWAKKHYGHDVLVRIIPIKKYSQATRYHVFIHDKKKYIEAGRPTLMEVLT